MHLAAAAGARDGGVRADRRAATRPIGEAHIVLTHPVWCRPCMLRECPLDHRCMRGVDVGRGARRGTARRCESRPCFSIATARMIEDVGYLDALDRVAFYPWTVDAIRALNRAGLPRRRGHEPVGRSRAASSPRRSSRRRTATSRRCSRRAARASTRITIVRTIPTARWRAYARRCDCRKPARGLVDRAAARSRRRSRAVVRRRRQVARRRLGRAVGARGDPGAHRLRRERGNAAAGRT